MSFELCTTRNVIDLAGEAANWDLTLSGAILDSLSNMVQGEMALFSKVDWVTNLAAATTSQTSGALQMICAAGIASHYLLHDTTNYLGNEKEIKLTWLVDRYVNGLTRISDEDGRTFMATGKKK